MCPKWQSRLTQPVRVSGLQYARQARTLRIYPRNRLWQKSCGKICGCVSVDGVGAEGGVCSGVGFIVETGRALKKEEVIT
jgi:hypothetical protein